MEPPSAFLTCSRVMPVILSRVHAQSVREDFGQAVAGIHSRDPGANGEAWDWGPPRATRSSEAAGP